MIKFMVEENNIIFEVMEKKIKIPHEDMEKIKKLIKDNKNYIKKIKKNTYEIRDYFKDEKKVPDAWRYIIKKQDNIFILESVAGKYSHLAEENKFGDVKTDEIPPERENIILILESPHKDEYSSDFTPLGPAQGATGKNIEKYFGKNLLPLAEKLIDKNFNGEYNLIISNPVQYQTSLYRLHKTSLGKSYAKRLRDRVWEMLFQEKKVKENFLERLISYKPFAIINGCTSTVSPAVTEFLKNDFLSAADFKSFIFKTTHPSSWYMGNNRKISLK